MKTLSVLLACTLLGGCAASGTRDAAESKKVTPLQLWSHHKSLDLSVSACGDKGFNALSTLGFTEVVRNGNYSYGVFGDSRAAVKCVEMPKGSFVYFGVASREREAAEQLRNAISAKM